MARRWALRALTTLVVVGLGALGGCRTAEEKLLDEEVALYAEAVDLLESHADKPNDGIAALTKLEEASRESRKDRGQAFGEALKGLDAEAKRAFTEEAKKRLEPLRTRLDTVAKRYPLELRGRIRDLVSQLRKKPPG